MFTRWPTLLAAVVLVSTGLALDVTNQQYRTFAVACLALGSSAFGAFLYAEGARHREWWGRSDSTDSSTDTSEDQP